MKPSEPSEAEEEPADSMEPEEAGSSSQVVASSQASHAGGRSRRSTRGAVVDLPPVVRSSSITENDEREDAEATPQPEAGQAEEAAPSLDVDAMTVRDLRVEQEKR